MKPVSGKRMCKILEDRGWAHDRTREPSTGRAISIPVHGNHDLRPGTQRTIMRFAELSEDDL